MNTSFWSIHPFILNTRFLRLSGSWKKSTWRTSVFTTIVLLKLWSEKKIVETVTPSGLMLECSIQHAPFTTVNYSGVITLNHEVLISTGLSSSRLKFNTTVWNQSGSVGHVSASLVLLIKTSTPFTEQSVWLLSLCLHFSHSEPCGLYMSAAFLWISCKQNLLLWLICQTS